jgi:hypothetical protein
MITWDDKGEGNGFIESGCRTEAFFITPTGAQRIALGYCSMTPY